MKTVSITSPLRVAALALGVAFAFTQLGTMSANAIPDSSPRPAPKKPSAKMKIKKCKKKGKAYYWSKRHKKCLKKTSELMTDDDLYYAAIDLAKSGSYSEARDLLYRIKNQNQPRVLNYLGFTTRKLGDVDEGLKYYKMALKLDPNYHLARAYMGEGYLKKGDLPKAKEQLVELETRCGKCKAYVELSKSITKFKAKS